MGTNLLDRSSPGTGPESIALEAEIPSDEVDGTTTGRRILLGLGGREVHACRAADDRPWAEHPNNRSGLTASTSQMLDQVRPCSTSMTGPPSTTYCTACAQPPAASRLPVRTCDDARRTCEVPMPPLIDWRMWSSQPPAPPEHTKSGKHVRMSASATTRASAYGRSAGGAHGGRASAPAGLLQRCM